MIFTLNFLHFIKSFLHAIINFILIYCFWLVIYYLTIDGNLDFSSITVGFFIAYFMFVIYQIFNELKKKNIVFLLSIFIQIIFFILFASDINRSIGNLGESVQTRFVMTFVVLLITILVYILLSLFVKKYTKYVFENSDLFYKGYVVDYEEEDVINEVYLLSEYNIFNVKYVMKDID